MTRKRKRPSRVKRWTKLTKNEKAARVRALAVLRLMRRGKSLLSASHAEGIKPETVLNILVLYSTNADANGARRKMTI
jgi:hypothetical protein